MTKKELRKLYLAKRATLSPEDSKQLSIEIGKRILETIDFSLLQNIHVFLSSTRHIEIDTFLIMKMIKDNHPNVGFIVPKSNYETNSFINLKYELGDELVYDSFGIPEPKNLLEVSSNMVDLVFMPLICCDKNGHRVGYGKGFYDRFLETLPAEINRIGLSFFNPCEVISDVGDHDKPLTSCITPEAVFEFI